MTPPRQSLLMCSLVATLILRLESVDANLPLESQVDYRQRRAISTCEEGKYFDVASSICLQCTLCSKGYTSANDCGDGPGTCERCETGFFQDEDDSTGICQHCLICLNRVPQTRCKRESDRECGGCLKGYYERDGALCVDCSTLKNRNRQDACRDEPKTTTVIPVVVEPSTPVPVIETTTPAPDDTTTMTDAPYIMTTITEAPRWTNGATGHRGPATPITGPGDDHSPSTVPITGGDHNGVRSFECGRLCFSLSLIGGILLAIVILLCVLRPSGRHVKRLCKRFGRLFFRARVQQSYRFQLRPMMPGGIEADMETRTPSSLEQETYSFIEHASEDAVIQDGDGYLIQGDGGECATSVGGAAGARGESSTDTSTFPDLLVVLNEAITEVQLKDFIQYCEMRQKLKPASCDEAAESLMKCARLMSDSNDMGNLEFLTFLHKYLDLKGLAKLCGIIKKSYPDIDCGTNEAAIDDEINYLQLLEDFLRETNSLQVEVDLELLGPEIGPLLEKEVKGVGGLFEIGVELGVEAEVAHKLEHYVSMKNLLQMSRPGLTVLKFAQALDKKNRKLVVKKIYERMLLLLTD